MEKLEITLEEIPIEEKEEIKPLQDTGYKGLKLIDERVHYSGTSIKYWM